MIVFKIRDTEKLILNHCLLSVPLLFLTFTYQLDDCTLKITLVSRLLSSPTLPFSLQAAYIPPGTAVVSSSWALPLLSLPSQSTISLNIAQIWKPLLRSCQWPCTPEGQPRPPFGPTPYLASALPVFFLRCSFSEHNICKSRFFSGCYLYKLSCLPMGSPPSPGRMSLPP
jgi:hypothetical protein